MFRAISVEMSERLTCIICKSEKQITEYIKEEMAYLQGKGEFLPNLEYVGGFLVTLIPQVVVHS